MKKPFILLLILCLLLCCCGCRSLMNYDYVIHADGSVTGQLELLISASAFDEYDISPEEYFSYLEHGIDDTTLVVLQGELYYKVSESIRCVPEDVLSSFTPDAAEPSAAYRIWEEDGIRYIALSFHTMSAAEAVASGSTAAFNVYPEDAAWAQEAVDCGCFKYIYSVTFENGLCDVIISDPEADGGDVTVAGNSVSVNMAQLDGSVFVYGVLGSADTGLSDTGPFIDVPASFRCAPAVAWAYAEGITSGMTENTFEPSGTVTRAEVMTFLWRAAGCPEPESETHPFTDVPAGKWYTKAVLWAYENGIAKGVSETSYAPSKKCCHEEILTFLWRAAGSPVYPADGESWYAGAYAWAEAEGLLSPFSPEQSGFGDSCAAGFFCTRGDAVLMLYLQYAE